MKISFKSISQIAKSIFCSKLSKKAWQVYNRVKAYYISINVWAGSMRYELFSDAMKIAKRLLEFETAGVVLFKKVGTNELQKRNILMGVLDFEPIRGLIYRFIDKGVLEENGGDVKASIRSFRLSHIA